MNRQTILMLAVVAVALLGGCDSDPPAEKAPKTCPDDPVCDRPSDNNDLPTVDSRRSHGK